MLQCITMLLSLLDQRSPQSAGSATPMQEDRQTKVAKALQRTQNCPPAGTLRQLFPSSGKFHATSPATAMAIA
jgi:hypothetical protein